MLYEIRVQGQINSRVLQLFSNLPTMTVYTVDEVTVSSITGELMDQAALAGVLNFLYDTGMPLLYVDCQDGIEHANKDQMQSVSSC